MKTTTKKARALWIAIHLVCATVATASPANQGVEPARAAAPVVVVEDQRPLAEADAPVDEPAAEPETRLRRIRGSEMNVGLVQKAGEIIREHHKKAYGTDIPFEIDGQRYVGRIERHYHPPGGELRPWGHHPGCSLFVVETAQ